MDKNIWENFNFSERNGKSAYDYLVGLKDSFIAKTGGVLSLDVEANSSSDYQSMNYRLFIVCENLGNYRKQILAVKEDNSSYFPVTIMSHGLTDRVFSFVEENDFLNKIEEMITTSSIKRTIENLYSQSIENK